MSVVQTVKTVDSSENNSKVIDSWIKNIADLHRTQPAPTVHYSQYVPQLMLKTCSSPFYLEMFKKVAKCHS